MDTTETAVPTPEADKPEVNGVVSERGRHKQLQRKRKRKSNPTEPPREDYDGSGPDSSDEEDVRNTVGEIPMHWYDEYPHLGYDLDGEMIMKPKQGDQLDKFLNRMENPEFWRTVHDKLTGQGVVLSDEDVITLQRLQSGQVPDENYDMYQPFIDFFTHDVLEMPLTGQNPYKSSFLPSKHEKEMVSRMVHAMKMGWISTKKTKRKTSQDKQENQEFYMLWKTNDQSEYMRRVANHIPAPKMKLPDHAESYNPPPEYLFTQQEKRLWEYQGEEEPEKSKYSFIPQKYKSLRQVPSYPMFIRERFNRCLDLYLAPRQKRQRLTIEAEDLLPKLPKPKDLHPFPVFNGLIYKGHRGIIRSIHVESTGQYLASGSNDKTVKVWE